jgi:predicted alpha-1,2-mannosidase
MSDMSLWDTYRTVAPLYSWLAPASGRDQAHSLLGFGDGLGAFPRWPIAIGESGTMLGASAEVAVADAVARGHVAMSELGDTYARMRAAAVDTIAPAGGRGGRGDVQGYLALGYVPRDQAGRSASATTEYAQDDFALAQLATAAGHADDAAMLIERSHGWRKLYDPAVGFVRGKNADGTFPTGAFDPLAITDDYAEANAWQSLWMTGLHDPEGMAAIFGSTQAALDKLTMFFEQAKTDLETADPSAANFPRPYYWHGNEPDLNAAALFAQLGRPDLAQQWTRWIEDTLYSDQPDGVAGNDDGGTLGAWYVLNALGLYPVAGSDRWIVVAPRFARATVTVGGHALQIVAEGTGFYVQAVELDGAPVTALTQAQLDGGSVLHFAMGTTPGM